MHLVVKDFVFEDEFGKDVEGVFFFDEDVINEKEAEQIIYEHGPFLNNRVFSQEAPCFFLPKAQADMLRHIWVPHIKEEHKEDVER